MDRQIFWIAKEELILSGLRYGSRSGTSASKVGLITTQANRGAGNLLVNFQKAVRFPGASQHNQVKAGRVKTR